MMTRMRKTKETTMWSIGLIVTLIGLLEEKIAPFLIEKMPNGVWLKQYAYEILWRRKIGPWSCRPNSKKETRETLLAPRR